MSDDIKPETIKATQETLGKFIKKPPLSEKLLKKPPFRFLHDVVTATIRDTGFLSGLYSEAEMQSENIKDRDTKIAFLQKLIDCVKITTEKNISARPSKIVAGLEPAKTNELLQAIGYALNKKLDSSAAVAQLQGNGESKSKQKSKEEKKTSKVKEKPEKVKKTSSISTTPRTKKSLENVSIKKKSEDKIKIKESPKSKPEKTSTVNKVKESPRSKLDKTSPRTKLDKTSPRTKLDKTSPRTKVDKTKDERKKEKSSSKSKDTDLKKSLSSPKEKTDSMKEPENIIEPEILEENEINPKTEFNSLESTKPDLTNTDIPSLPLDISENKTESETKIQSTEIESTTPKYNLPEIEVIVEKPTPEEMREKSSSIKRSKSRREQPMVAVPLAEALPEMKSKEPSKMEISRPKTSLRPPSVRPSSARPGAPRLKDRNEIILPPDEVVSMGKVKVIVENFSAQDDDNEETVVVETIPELTYQEPFPPPKPDIDIPAEKGHLVAQILEQIGDSSLDGPEVKKPVEIEWEGGGKRNREAASKEMEKLRQSIQTLTRAANPLGKLMNFLQEDIDSMRSELKLWIEINEKLIDEIKTQERINEESVEPLKKQISLLDEDIFKQNEQIELTKANIIKNEQKIKMLLTREV